MEGFRQMDPDQLAWVIAGALLTLAVAAVVWRMIGAFTFGLFIYYALRPLYRWINRRIDNREVSATLALVAFGIPLILVLGYAGLTAYQEVNSLLGRAGLTQFRSVLQPYVDLSRLTDPGRLLELLGGNVDRLTAYAGTLFIWGMRFIITVIVAFYLLRDDNLIGDWFRESFDGNDQIVEFMEAVDSQLGTIYTGNLVTIIINTLLASTVFVAFNRLLGMTVVRYPVLLGLLVGVFTLLPAIGIMFVYGPYTAYLLVRAFVWGTLPGWIPFAFFAVNFVLVDIAPDYFIRAYVSARDINMGLMMLTFTLGVLVFGWYGIFLAPILLVLFLRFAKHVFPRIVQGWPDSPAAESD